MKIDDKVMGFIKEFNYISISDLHEILEHLNDSDLLNKKGKKFYHQFWEDLIREEP